MVIIGRFQRGAGVFGLALALLSTFDVRAAAGEPNVANLIAQIAKNDLGSPERIPAIRALRDLKNGASNAVPALLDVFDTSDKDLRFAAAAALTDMPLSDPSREVQVIEKMTDVLLSGTTAQKKDAAFVLTTHNTGGERTIRALVNCLAGEEYGLGSLQSEAARALASMGKSALPLLLAAVSDDSQTDATRHGAIEALGSMRPPLPEAVPTLIYVLNKESLVRVTVTALTNFGPVASEATRKLVGLLRRCTEPEDYSMLLRGLGAVSMGDEDSLAEIELCKRGGPLLKHQAEEALEKICERSPNAIGRVMASAGVGGEAVIAKWRGAAIPVLEAIIRGPDNPSVGKAIDILGRIGSPSVAAMVPIVEDQRLTPEVRLRAIKVISEIGRFGRPRGGAAPPTDSTDIENQLGLNPDRDTSAAIPALLRRVDDLKEPESIRTWAATTLLRHPKDADVRGHFSKILDALSEESVRSAREDLPYFAPFDATMRATLLDGVQHGPLIRRQLVIQVLGTARDQNAVTVLAKLAADRTAEAELRSDALGAIAAIRPEDNDTLTVLIRCVAETSLASNAARALEPFKLRAVPALNQLLLNSSKPPREVLVFLANLGAGAEGALPGITRALQDEQSESDVMECLFRMGAPALSVSPVLLRWAERSSGGADTERRDRLEGLGRLLGAAARDALEKGKWQYVPKALWAQSRLSAAVEDGSSRAGAGGDEGSIQTGVTALRTYTRAGLTRLLVFALVPLMILSVGFTASGRLRRSFLTLLGRKWEAVVGSPDHTVELVAHAPDVLLTIRSETASALVPRFTIPSSRDGSPALPDAVRVSFRAGENILATVDETVFSTNWARQLGTEWTAGKDAIVAGQVCAVSGLPPRRVPSARRISVTVLQCSTPASGSAPLHGTKAEAAAVGKIFLKWGARVRMVEADATVEDTRRALLEADIVHIAAHASPAAIELADGIFRAADISAEYAEKIRCRLLVLSACSAANLAGGDATLVGRLVREGINTVGAVAPVDDQVCRMFFEEFYRALLPRKQAQGVQLATAIRRSAEECARRINPGGKIADATVRHRLADINSFVLYGDPTLQFRLGSVAKGTQ